ncbi:hypothetical protein HAX54_001108 [Datura stramonium]|uniref:Uncharacterized protein n=1 Tax=Datura stramonium TaxID=4076 RepID=A0ABS8RVL8_DATST|nr:hypothetical protein [Datura stramonium]
MDLVDVGCILQVVPSKLLIVIASMMRRIRCARVFVCRLSFLYVGQACKSQLDSMIFPSWGKNDVNVRCAGCIHPLSAELLKLIVGFVDFCILS